MDSINRFCWEECRDPRRRTGVIIGTGESSHDANGDKDGDLTEHCGGDADGSNLRGLRR